VGKGEDTEQLQVIGLLHNYGIKTLLDDCVAKERRAGIFKPKVGS